VYRCKACLDHAFKNQACVVNHVQHETELVYIKTKNQSVLRLLVVVLLECQLQQLLQVVVMP
jgi:hypothetical protein